MERYAKVAENSKMPKQLAQAYSKEVREYWDSRGIDMRHPLRHRVYEFVMARKPILGFPTYMGETLVDVKFLDIRWTPDMDSPKWWNIGKKFGTRTLPWGIDQLNFIEGEKKIVTITEGHIDAMTWEQCNYKNILSVPSGAPSVNAINFEHEFDYLEDPFTKSKLAEVELFILSTDGDLPGIKLRNHIALILGKDKCKYIQYPQNFKDINEVFNGSVKKGLPALGKAGVDECYNNLSSFPAKGIVRPQDVREELEILAADGFQPGYGIGIPEMDKLFTLKKKHFTVVTGLPSSGKSVFVRWYLSEFVRHNDKENLKWAMFTPENRPVSREQAKLAEVITGQSFKRGYKNSMTEDLRGKTMRYIQKNFFFIAPSKMNFESWDGTIKPDKVNTMDSLLSYLMYLKKTENIFGFVIDAWNKIEHEQAKNVTETQFISQQLDYLINFCDVYDLHCILIAHPTKIEKQGINYRMPCLYDIKGSSAWKEKPDIGIVLHRYINKKRPAFDIPEDATDDDKIVIDKDAPTIMNIEKIRFEEIGRMGKLKLRMDYAKGGRFFVIDDKKKPEIPDIQGKLNPKQDEEEEVFGNNDNGDQLPF
jgi:twinkle protein